MAARSVVLVLTSEVMHAIVKASASDRAQARRAQVEFDCLAIAEEWDAERAQWCMEKLGIRMVQTKVESHDRTGEATTTTAPPSLTMTEENKTAAPEMVTTATTAAETPTTASTVAESGMATASMGLTKAETTKEKARMEMAMEGTTSPAEEAHAVIAASSSELVRVPMARGGRDGEPMALVDRGAVDARSSSDSVVPAEGRSDLSKAFAPAAIVAAFGAGGFWFGTGRRRDAQQAVAEYSHVGGGSPA